VREKERKRERDCSQNDVVNCKMIGCTLPTILIPPTELLTDCRASRSLYHNLQTIGALLSIAIELIQSLITNDNIIFLYERTAALENQTGPGPAVPDF
jgi:hypothetical protein